MKKLVIIDDDQKIRISSVSVCNPRMNSSIRVILKRHLASFSNTSPTPSCWTSLCPVTPASNCVRACIRSVTPHRSLYSSSPVKTVPSSGNIARVLAPGGTLKNRSISRPWNGTGDRARRTKTGDDVPHLRVPLKVRLKLVGRDGSNTLISESVTTENISAGGFLCACSALLIKDTVFNVYLEGISERYVGKASVVRKEDSGAPWQKYGFQFVEKTEDWLLQ